MVVLKKPPSYKDLERTAIRAAHASGRVLMKYFRTKLQVNVKADQGLVTNADLESERVAMQILKKSFPDFWIFNRRICRANRKLPRKVGFGSARRHG